jgi:hypothetical protein
MMTYAKNLILPISPLSKPVESIPKVPHTKLAIESHINIELINYLNDRNLLISFAETFYMKPNSFSIIHCDTKNYTDVAKLNYVYRGNDSTMNWYKTKDTSLRDITPSELGTNYRKYDLDEVELIYQHTVSFPTLVQAGVPHNVTTHTEDRMCISLFLMNKTTNKYISFSEGLSLFTS